MELPVGVLGWLGGEDAGNEVWLCGLCGRGLVCLCEDGLEVGDPEGLELEFEVHGRGAWPNKAQHG